MKVMLMNLQTLWIRCFLAILTASFFTHVTFADTEESDESATGNSNEAKVLDNEDVEAEVAAAKPLFLFGDKSGISINRLEVQINVNKYAYRDSTDDPWAGADNSDFDRVTFGESNFLMETGWRDKIINVTKLNLSHLFDYEDGNQVDFTDDFDINRFVENSFFEFREIGGEPVVVIVGKRDIRVGLLDFEESYQTNQSWWRKLTHSRFGVLGVTVRLDVSESSWADHLLFVDSVEVMLFEDHGGDFKWDSQLTTMATRFEKQIGDTTFVFSYTHREHENSRYYGTEIYEDENTFSLGGKRDINDSLTLWAEGALFENHIFNQKYDSMKAGLSIGGSLDLSEAITLTTTGAIIGNFGHEFAATLHSDIPFGPQFLQDHGQMRFLYRWRGYDDRSSTYIDSSTGERMTVPWEDDHLFGVELQINFDLLNHPSNKRNTSLSFAPQNSSKTRAGM